MTITNQDKLDVARTVAKTAYEDTFLNAAPSTYEMFVDEFTDGSDRTDVGFVSFLGAMEEWIGEKEVTNWEAFQQTLVLKYYHVTQSLKRGSLLYDASGRTASSLASWIRSQGGGVNKIVHDVLFSNTGEGPAAFDSVNLISTSHSVAGISYSNKTTAALSFSSVETARTAMTSYVGANSETLGINPTHLMYGPKLEQTAQEIIRSTQVPQWLKNTGARNVDGAAGTGAVASSNSNVNTFSGLQPIFNPKLIGTQDDYWYLLDLSKEDKPLLVKKERDIELVEQTDMDCEQRFNHDEYVWSLEGDFVVAAGAFPLIYGGIL